MKLLCPLGRIAQYSNISLTHDHIQVMVIYLIFWKSASIMWTKGKGKGPYNGPMLKVYVYVVGDLMTKMTDESDITAR